mgnify:FL=1
MAKWRMVDRIAIEAAVYALEYAVDREHRLGREERYRRVDALWAGGVTRREIDDRRMG